MRTATAGAIAVLSVLVAGVGIATASNGAMDLSKISTPVRANKGQEIHLFCAGATTPTPPATLGGIIIGGGMNVDRVQSLTAGQNAAPDTTVGSLLRKK